VCGVIKEVTTIAVPWTVVAAFLILTACRYLQEVKYMRFKPSSADFDPDLVILLIKSFTAGALAVFVTFPPGRHFLLPHLTPLFLWLTAVICGLSCLVCWLLFERVLGGDNLGTVLLIGSLLLLPLAIDAGGIALSQWLIDIGLRVNDWLLIASPLTWFVVALLLVVTILDTDDLRANLKDNDFLFKLAALAGSLLCLIQALDMDLRSTSGSIFLPPFVWFTLGSSALFVSTAYYLSISSDKDEARAKKRKLHAALGGGFFLPVALNALLIGLYLY